MTAMATNNGLTHKIAESADQFVTPANLEDMSRRIWSYLLRNSRVSQRYHNRDGFTYRGALPLQSMCGRVRENLNGDQREVLDNAIRAFLRQSGNAICTNRQKGSIEWWVSSEWTPSTAIPTIRQVDRNNGQENWFEKKVTEKEITGGYEPFPVTVRDGNGKVKTAKKFVLDPRWRDEIHNTLIRSGADGAMRRVVEMTSTWTQSFTTHDFATLYNATIMMPAQPLSTLVDAGLITQIERSDVRLHSRWVTTAEQREELVAIHEAAKVDLSYRSITDRDGLLAVLRSDRPMTTTEVARAAIMGRSRLINMLRSLILVDQVERVHVGGGSTESTWRLTSKARRTVSPVKIESELESRNPAKATKPKIDPPKSPIAEKPASDAKPSPAAVPPKKPIVADPFVVPTSSNVATNANDLPVSDSNSSETDDLASYVERHVARRVEEQVRDTKDQLRQTKEALESTRGQLAEEIKNGQKLQRELDKTKGYEAEITELREWKQRMLKLIGS